MKEADGKTAAGRMESALGAPSAGVPETRHNLL